MSSICEGLKATESSGAELVTHVGARATKFERYNMATTSRKSSWIVHYAKAAAAAGGGTSTFMADGYAAIVLSDRLLASGSVRKSLGVEPPAVTLLEGPQPPPASTSTLVAAMQKTGQVPRFALLAVTSGGISVLDEIATITLACDASPATNELSLSSSSLSTSAPHQILELVTNNSAKPGRPVGPRSPESAATGTDFTAWVAVSTQDFAEDVIQRLGLTQRGSKEHDQVLEEAADAMGTALTKVLCAAYSSSSSGDPIANPVHLRYKQAHRWGACFPTGIVADTAVDLCLASEEDGVFACGDWVCGGSVEGAILSGAAAAEKIKIMLLSSN